MKATLSGQINLLEEDSSNTKIAGFDLSKISALTGLNEHDFKRIKFKDSDTTVSLGVGFIDPIRLVVLVVSGPGTVIFKHDGNSAGIELAPGILAFTGAITLPTVETVSTQDMTVDYLIAG